MRRFKSLEVWKRSMEMADFAYTLVDNFPKHLIYGIGVQIQKSAASVPSNIAEGHDRNSTKEFLQFLGYASGSLSELETQIIIAANRKYITSEESKKMDSYFEEVSKMLWGLRSSLRKKL